MNEPTKDCSKCRLALPLSSFDKNRATKDGLQYRCRSCRLEDRRENRHWSNGNKDRIREYQKLAAQRYRAAGYPGRKEHRAKNRADGGPEYAAKLLNMRVTEAGPELLKLKQQQIQVKRMAKAARKAIHEARKDSC